MKALQLLLAFTFTMIPGCAEAPSNSSARSQVAATNVEEKPEPKPSDDAQSEKAADVTPVAAAQPRLGVDNSSTDASAAAFTPDGKKLLVGFVSGLGLYLGGKPRPPELYDVETGKLIAKIDEIGWIHTRRRMQLLPDGNRVVLFQGYQNKFMQPEIWDLTTRKQVSPFAEPPDGRDFSFSGDATRFLTYFVEKVDNKPKTRGLALWDVKSGKMLRKFGETQVAGLGSVVLSPDGKWALSSYGPFEGIDDSAIKLWRVEDGKEIRTWNRSQGWTGGFAGPDVPLAFTPDSQRVVLQQGKQDEPVELVILDVATGKDVRRLKTPSAAHRLAGAQRISITPDSKRLLAYFDGVLASFDFESGREMWSIKTEHRPKAVAFCADCRVVFVAGGSTANANKMRLHLWDGITGKFIRKLEGSGPGTWKGKDIDP